MEKLKHEIQRIKRHNLEYYHSHLEIIEKYIEEKPDITIETCKSTIEGIAKLSLHILKHEPLASHKNESLGPLCRRALESLQEGRGFSDAKLCSKLTSVIEYIGLIRNDHCDIGHGRASLKDQVNDADFADLILGLTDSLGTYMLRRLDYLAEPVVQYDDNPDFNEYLDDLNKLPDSVLYSQALFEQYPETYRIKLADYKLELEAEANE